MSILCQKAFTTISNIGLPPKKLQNWYIGARVWHFWFRKQNVNVKSVTFLVSRPGSRLKCHSVIGATVQDPMSRVQSLFGTFPKIHPFWRHHPSLSLIVGCLTFYLPFVMLSFKTQFCVFCTLWPVLPWISQQLPSPNYKSFQLWLIREFLYSAPLTKRRWGWISQQERPTNWHLAAAVSNPLIFLPKFCHTLYPSILPGIQNYNYLICWIWEKKTFFQKIKSFLWLSVWECFCGPLWDLRFQKFGLFR